MEYNKAMSARSPTAPQPVFDVALSSDLLHLLNVQVRLLPGPDQGRLETFLKGEVDPSYANDALVALWNCDPSLTKRLELASGGKNLDPSLMSASLFVWALNQPWAEKIDMKRALTKWTGYVVTKSPNNESNQLPRACAYLEQLRPLILQIPQNQRPIFLTSLYHELTWLISKDEDRPRVGELVCAMGVLADHCREELSTYYLPLPEQWVRNTHAIFDAASQQKKDIVKMCAAIADSALPTDLKARALKGGPAAAWALPSVAVYILPTLVQDEFHRFSQLPWEENTRFSALEETLADNQAVMHMYCPTIAPIVEMVAAVDDWLDKESMQIFVDPFHPDNTPAAEDVFALPEDMEPL